MTSAALSHAERVAWLRLARADGVGPVTFQHLLGRFGSAEEALAALPDVARRAGRASAPRTLSQAQAESELDAGDRLGARLLCASEPDFPALLAAVDPPPPMIWTWGRVDLLSRPAVAVVGARIASAAGQRFARTVAADLGQAGYVVVSGMARGIDGAAHEGALPTGTAAVLAGGIDDIYPAEHRGLHQRLRVEGCVVSESAVGQKAKAQDFPRRNRLISGLSLGVIVVEAELRSGSLITARLAGEQGREVFAVPGSPLDPRARGTNDLIRQGAILCEGIDDVLRELEAQSIRPRRPRREAIEAVSDLEVDEVRDRVEALLSPTPTPKDELVRAAGATPAAAYAALAELELAGRAELLPGGMVVRAC